MIYAYQIAFRKGPQHEEAGAKLGNNRMGVRQREGGRSMVRQAIAKRGTTVVPWTPVVPVNDDEAKKEFAAVILNISRGQLAKAAKRGKDAAKRWQEGTRLPSMLTILNMAQPGDAGIPVVRNYVLTKLGINPAMLSAAEQISFQTPQMMEAAIAAVYQVMHQPGPDGDAVRAALLKAGNPYRGKNRP